MPNNQETKKTEKVKKKRLDWAQVFGLYSYLLPYKKVFLPSLVALFLTAGLSLAFPYFLGSLIGSPAEAMRGESEIDAGVVGGRIDSVVKWLLGILLLQAFISYWRVRGFIKAGEGALRDLRADVFGRLVRLPVGWFMERRTGEVSARVAGDLGILRDTLLTTVPQLARQLVILIGGLVFVFISSVKLSLFMLAVIPVVVLAVAFFGRKIRGFSTEAQDRLAESNVVVEEAVQGIMDVKAFTNESFEEDRYGKSLDRFLKVTMDGAKARAAFVSFIIFVLFGTISLVVWFGAGMLVRGELTGEEFARFILFSVFVGASLGAFPDIISQLQKTAGATQRVKEILNEEPEVVTEAVVEPNDSSTISGALKVDNVQFSYPSRPEVSVLNGLDFEVKAGERVAIVGSSGGGKSTLFSLLLGFYQPNTGSLVFDGNSELSIKQIRKAMAVVPQEVLLFGGSILENIQYGKTCASLEEVQEAARRANAHDFIEEFPEAYETLVGPRGVKLSGGQRQRVAIARAILADPKILLLDEATSALDSENERLVQGALDELMQKRTSLIIAHRLATVREADRILVLHGGKIAEAGTHDELMQQGGLYRVLAETQLMQS